MGLRRRLSTGLHQLALDTFWYIDPNAGVDGVIHNSLAAGPPEYNDDFSEMTVFLRQGIYWSDGVEFTSADVVYTVESQIEHPGATWSGAFSTNVESVQAIDDYTVRFILKAPNSRFQSVFSVRWNAAWIIPKHIFENEDPTTFEFNPPVSLGPYTLHSYDPNGSWHIWERRPDWERTTVAEFGMPAPRYAIYRHGIPTDRRLIEMRQRRPRHDPRPHARGHVLDREAGRDYPGLVPGASRTRTPTRRSPPWCSTPRTRSSRTSGCAGRWR